MKVCFTLLFSALVVFSLSMPGIAQEDNGGIKQRRAGAHTTSKPKKEKQAKKERKGKKPKKAEITNIQ